MSASEASIKMGRDFLGFVDDFLCGAHHALSRADGNRARAVSAHAHRRVGRVTMDSISTMLSSMPIISAITLREGGFMPLSMAMRCRSSRHDAARRVHAHRGTIHKGPARAPELSNEVATARCRRLRCSSSRQSRAACHLALRSSLRRASKPAIDRPSFQACIHGCGGSRRCHIRRRQVSGIGEAQSMKF